MDKKELRKEKRKNEESRVVIETFPGPDSPETKTLIALTQDVSLGGARIRVDEPFPVGARLRINLTLSRIRQVIRLEAEVRWIKPLFDGELFDIGVEFDHKIHGDIMTLIRHMYGLATGEAPPSPEDE